jgi:hypothetical protein
MARQVAKLTTPAKPDWGQLGPAMRALPNSQWREFVHAFVTCPLKPSRSGNVYGRHVYAARKANFGKGSTPANLGKLAWKMANDERCVAAIAEETQKYFRSFHPAAVAAYGDLIRDRTHKDHGRAVMRAIDSIDPIVSKQDISVTHKVTDLDQEGLEELRALRELGVSREKMLEQFGGNGLARLERLEAADMARRANEAKVIDGREIEAPHG